MASSAKMGSADTQAVYLAVRAAGHGRWRALRCCNDVRRGSWRARDAGELKAQMVLIGEALRDAD